MASPCGWFGTIEQFINIDRDSWLTHLRAHHFVCMNVTEDASQGTAWINEFPALKSGLSTFIAEYPKATEWTLIFEYELPRERGRRPDVVILGPSIIFVIEFKDYSHVMQAHLDQVSAYARDLKHYHSGSHSYEVIPLLFLTKSHFSNEKHDDVTVISQETLKSALFEHLHHLDHSLIDPRQWIHAEYSPLPSLVHAARLIFKNEPLPQIKRALSAGIPQTIEAMVNIAKEAKEKNELHLIFVTGVPGSGKTLVGLQFVYENQLEDSDIKNNAVFLSGNMPLVKVLQHALKSPVFVQDVHGFLKQYSGTTSNIPHEHIWVYDEAQRAWDADRVMQKRNHFTSEPEDFLRLAERMNSWGVMVALIGEGQEIHIGEEAGLSQWNDAVAAMRKPWIVHCPQKIAHIFNASSTNHIDNALDLTMTLRSHLAEDVTKWVHLVLEGNLPEARELSAHIYAQGFDLYLTNDLNVAKSYVQERYSGDLEKRYGLLASSKATNLPEWGIHNEYNYTRNMREGPWYNDPQSSIYSSCALRDVATEFSCQGLELDFPIVCWGKDMRWEGHEWRKVKKTARTQAKDPQQLRLNSYRVLLTRGRDGLIIFVPMEAEMASTYEALKMAGVKELPIGNGALEMERGVVK